MTMRIPAGLGMGEKETLAVAETQTQRESLQGLLHKGPDLQWGGNT